MGEKQKEEQDLIVKDEEKSGWRVNWANPNNRVLQGVVLTIILLIICIIGGWFF